MKNLIVNVSAFAFAVQYVAGHVIARSATTSSSASASSATPVKNTGKRGLAYNNPLFSNYFALSGQNSQVSWGYNWYYEETNPSQLNSAVEYIPLLYNNNADLLKAWPTAAQKAIDNGATALFSFNEPDLPYADGGINEMSISDAVDTWQKYMEPFAGKATLVAPAVTNAGSPYGLTWLEEFLEACTNCTIDAINIHWYSNKWAGFNYLKSQVNSAITIADGRPVWLTEFGLDNSDGTYTDDDLHSFLQSALPWLDANDSVERYAYFWNAAGYLMNSAGTALSNSGVLYNNYTTSSSTASSSKSSAVASSTSVSPSSKTSSSVATTLITSSTSSKITSSSTVSSSSFVKSTTASASPAASSSSSTVSSSTLIKTSSSSVVSSSTSIKPSSTSSVSSSSSVASSSVSVKSSSVISSSSSTSAKSSSTSSVASSTAIKAAIVASSSTLVSTSSTKSSSASSSATASPTISILSAYFATANVSASAKSSLLQSGNIVIDTSNLAALNGGTDPWYGVTKCFSILYTVGNDTRVAVVVEQSGTYTITPSGSLQSFESVVPSFTVPSTSPVDVIAAIWGKKAIATQSVWTSLYYQATTNWGFQISTSLFGVDGYWGVSKSAVIWYTKNGMLKALVGKENSWVQFS